MFKIISFIFVVTFFLKCNAVKLHGDEFDTAAKILHEALNRINDLEEGIYSSRSIDAAYKFVPNEVYTYEVSVGEFTGETKSCVITISYAYTDVNALMTIKCEGDTEVTKTIINEMIVV